MKVVIFGSTGKTGRCLVEQALTQGHDVTAFTRNPGKLGIQHERLKAHAGDVLDGKAVAAAVAGQDAVLCALGPANFKKPNTVVSEGTKNILLAMQKHGVPRLVCQSAIGIGDSKGQGPFVFKKIILPLFLKHVYADKERQEEEVRRSDLDWIIVRPSRLMDWPARGAYQVSIDGTPVPGKIARADVAAFMLQQLSSDQYLRKTPLVGG
jgi:putative NADH-flavin reductase